MLLRILSFNVGVELGQIAALIVMVGALAIFRKSTSFLRFSYFANLGLIAAGIYLLFVQLHGLSARHKRRAFPVPCRRAHPYSRRYGNSKCNHFTSKFTLIQRKENEKLYSNFYTGVSYYNFTVSFGWWWRRIATFTVASQLLRRQFSSVQISELKN